MFVNFFEMLIWLYKIYRGRHNKQEGRGCGSDSGGSPPTDYAGPGGSRRSDQPGIYQGRHPQPGQRHHATGMDKMSYRSTQTILTLTNFNKKKSFTVTSISLEIHVKLSRMS